MTIAQPGVGGSDAPKGPPKSRSGETSGGAGPVLPWMCVPLTIESGSGIPVEKVLGLDARLASQLRNGFGFPELFPVQTAVWQHSAGGTSTAHDLCVAAPTGSGKTLAYALPVVNSLAEVLPGRKASVGCLRALVVLPTRDLAVQVYDVFRPLCDAVQLNVALAAARTSEAAEAAAIVGLPASSSSSSPFVAGGGSAAAPGCRRGADVLVATPGRLMSHLSGSPGVSLRHLRFLVADETDRLLRQSYQSWLPRVLAHIEPLAQPQHPPRAHHTYQQQHHQQQHHQQQHHQQQHHQQPPQAGLPDGWPSGAPAAAACDHFAAFWPGASTGSALPFAQPRVVKIVVSATLTRDPAKLQRLALHHPRFVATATAAGGGGGGAAAGRYSLPRSLSEYRLMCSAARKPLVLLALLQEWSGQSTIVFTSSLEMTHKLFLMLSAVQDLPDEVVEYSSLVPVRARAAALERFRTGSAKVLVASDAMTRGMDVDCVQNVINYDAPVYAKTYVHRAGRTARAGKPGRVITLLRDEDMRHFKAMIHKADNNFVREYKLPSERVEALRPALTGALQQLEELLAAERASDMQQQQQQQQQQAKQQKQKAVTQLQGFENGKPEALGKGKQKGVEKGQQAETAAEVAEGKRQHQAQKDSGGQQKHPTQSVKEGDEAPRQREEGARLNGAVGGKKGLKRDREQLPDGSRKRKIRGTKK